MGENNGSASAVIAAGKGGRKRKGSSYDLRDKVLIGVYALPDSTVNEIATEYYDWYREPYKNAPKRAQDLLKLGYVELLDNRTCRYTGKSSHVYRITQKGLDYLREHKKMPTLAKAKIISEEVGVKRVRPDFASMRPSV